MDVTIRTERVTEMKDKVSKVVESCHNLFREMSDAVVGTIAEMYPDNEISDPDRPVRVILKNNRHMYIVLLLILLLTLYTVFFR